MKNIVTFQKFKPAEALSPYVAGYWYMDSLPNDGEIGKCFPTGFLDIITVVGGSPNLLFQRGEWGPTPQAMVVGIRTEPVQLKTPAQNIVFGIRLYPETFLQLLQRPIRELVNNTESVADVFSADLVELTEKLALLQDNESRVALCNRYFQHLLTRTQPVPTYLAEAIRQARQLGANASAEVLSRRVFVGERQLQRAFSEQVGVSPKLYGRLIRFGQAAEMPLKDPDVSWTEVSYDLGYADQAHLIREFKGFSGVRPTKFLKDPMAVQMAG